MINKKVLLTGSTGTLGKAIMSSGLFRNILAPNRNEMDITDQKSISEYFGQNSFQIVIHCAAIARMVECEMNPSLAIKTNIIGTSNLVNSVIEKVKKKEADIRFIYISTDGVYGGNSGNYRENAPTIPYNSYGWTKLGAECVVRTLKNYCIIRTSFFDPKNIRYDDAAIDAFSSKIPVNKLAQAIALISKNNFVGTINVGGKKESEYIRYKKYKPSIKPTKLRKINESLPYNIPKDASLNTSLWKKLNSKNADKK